MSRVFLFVYSSFAIELTVLNKFHHITCTWLTSWLYLFSRKLHLLWVTNTSKKYKMMRFTFIPRNFKRRKLLSTCLVFRHPNQIKNPRHFLVFDFSKVIHNISSYVSYERFYNRSRGFKFITINLSSSSRWSRWYFTSYCNNLTWWG